MAPSNSSPTFIATSEGDLTPALVIAAGAVLPIVGIVAVALRFYSRLQRHGSRLWVDDWLSLCSIFLTTGLGIMLIVGGSMHALAQPTELRPEPLSYLNYAADSLLLTEKIFWAFNLTQCFAFGTAKLSVLFFYCRIFRGPTFNTISITLIVVVCIWTIGFFFAIMFRCGKNFWALWAPLKDLLRNCYNSTPMFQAFSISDVIVDLLIISIPVCWVNKLQLPLGKKIAVCGIFLLGFLAIAAGIVRLVFFIQQSNNYEENEDGIGHLTTEMYWSMIEMGISVIAACLPAIRLLLKSVSPESMIRSARSHLSLRSQGPVNSDKPARPSRASHENIELTETPAASKKPWSTVKRDPELQG